jgi:hypothetical protein
MEEHSVELDIQNITVNYKDRVQRLAIFDPLFRLENKKTTDNSNHPIDYFSLGLLTLLFFFENKLLRNNKIGVKELARFFQNLNQTELDLDEAGFEKLARDIIDVFRPPGGKRNYRTFYDWNTRREETVYCTILKADKFDSKSNTQYYSLDEQGLELVFSTREYFSEFQVSINQLLLRKQLERGQFWGALRQIDEMRVAVETLQDKITRISHEIQRNIVSEPTYQRYRDTVEEINLRLSHEDQEFEELQNFVRETRERLIYERTTAKDQQAYELVVKIDAELAEVHGQHAQMLKESIELKTSALQAAQESLYYAGIDSFNFQKEITEQLMSIPLPLTAARVLAEPFLSLQQSEQWSPLTVFARQRLERRSGKTETEGFLELLDEKAREQEREALRRQYRLLMELILEAMGDQTEIRLQEVVEYCRSSQREDLLQCRFFYDFWILLHQRSPLVVESKAESREETLLGEMMEVLQGRAKNLTVMEKEEVINVINRYSIRDMRLSLEVDKNVL